MNKKEYNPEIALFPTRNGNMARINVNAAVFDLLQKAEIGTSLLLVPVSDEIKEKIAANGKTAPAYKLVILPPQENNGKGYSKGGRAASASDDL